MADLTWRVYRSTTEGGTYTQLDNVQSVTMQLGRNKVTDQWRPSTAIISGRVPSSLPSLAIDNFIKINNTSVTYDYWFRIADIKINYDFVTNGDTWEITCEAALATAGRSNVTASVMGGDETLYAMGVVLADAPINFVKSTGDGASFVSTFSLTDQNPIQAVQQLAFTEQAYLADYDFENTLVAFQRSTFTAAATITLTDDNTASTTYKIPYEQITFASLAEDYVTGVVIDPASYAAQTSGTLERSQSYASYDNSTAQAASLAAWVNVVLDQSSAVPHSVTTDVKRWSNATPLAYLILGSQITVRLRTVNYNCILEGVTIAATPERTRITTKLSPAAAYSFLTLDDPVLGLLDYNSVGF